MKKFGIFCCLFLMSFASQGVEITPYNQGQWKEVLSTAQGKSLIVHFWGVSCEPCLAEMANWGKLSQQLKQQKIVFIELDDAPVDVIKRIIEKGKVTHVQHMVLRSNFDEYMRFEVDKNWRGEMPITLLINKEGKVSKVVGIIKPSEIKQWVQANQ